MAIRAPLAKAVIARRQILAEQQFNIADLPADGPIGIAFSGGGIRSATISLGLSQALARRNKLLSFDYLSTVSGGGYFGSFLRSLFIPSRLRGEPDLHDPAALKQESAAQMNFALTALEAGPQDKIIESGEGKDRKTYTNPFWWLRENGRYLAPGGSVGYVTAFSFIARNWVAMLYMFMLAAAVLALALQAITIAAWYYLLPEEARAVWRVFDDSQRMPLSPILSLAAIFFVLALSVGVGYWFTEAMPSVAAWLPKSGREEKSSGRATSHFERLWLFFMVLVLATVSTIWFYPDVLFGLPPAGQTILGGGLVVSLLALLSAGWLYWRFRISEEGRALDGAIQQTATSHLRREMTDAVSAFNIALVITLAIGGLDTLAMAIRAATNLTGKQGGVSGIPAGIWLIAHPVAAWLIKKIQDWSKSGSQSSIGKWVSANSGAIILAIGISLFASVFTISDLLVQKAIWLGAPYASGPINNAVDWHSVWIMVAILLMLGSYACFSGGFINLSSIHNFYVNRLSRAYLGASNMERLLQGTTTSRVDKVSKMDFLHVEAYQRHACAAPLHLINVTLNETRSRHASNISKLDRKGECLTFGPEGVRIGNSLRNWDNLKKDNAEPLSVGQLMAISGAAASSGMGRRTTLGSALALTFANVRLGYWWRQCSDKRSWSRMLGPFYYLYNEMTARYSQDDTRLYLSDGGHFENSGALALMREGCKLIVVSDNEEDGSNAFEALEILMRTARIDLGREIEVLSAKETAALVGGSAKRHFFNMAKDDWRSAMLEPGGTSFALMMGIRTIGADTPGFDAWMIWLKPRCFAGLPLDVMAYARANPTFPHQSTVDQFFEEQQWESYRRLGYEMGSLMFGKRFGIREDLLPPITRPASGTG